MCRMSQCGRKGTARHFLCTEAELLVQSRHHGVGELSQLAGRQLGTLGNMLGVEGEQVVGGDEGPVERGQQM